MNAFVLITEVYPFTVYLSMNESGQTHYNPFTSKTKRAQANEFQQKQTTDANPSLKCAVERIRNWTRSHAFARPLKAISAPEPRLPSVFVQFFCLSALFVCMANAFACARHVYRLEEGRKFSKKAIVKAGQQDRFERGERKRVQYLLRSTAGLA